ncbi:MAG: carboxymuconolactone decarboxylase family protein [Ignavibacteriaceae bacterium]
MSKNVPLLSLQVTELVAIGASIGGNCLPCLRYHFAEARRLGVSIEEIKESIELGKMVKERPINDIYKLADDLISREQVEIN